MTMAMIGIMVVMSAVEMEEDAVEDERTKNRMVILSRYYVTEPLKHLGKAVWAIYMSESRRIEEGGRGEDQEKAEGEEEWKHTQTETVTGN